ncbi:WD40 repeat domain-containing protein [Streptomyces sp. NPDC048279]|uniref:WD40 repeat domain-containing protein n=1 Tax=Streptomyces sp. NPDC048279 TaxID=3154714 RepID=UPI00341972DF
MAEVLLKQPHSLTHAAHEPDPDEQQRIHRDIAATCAELARAAGQLAPHPYVRRHTVAHAHAGRALTDDVMPLQLAARESSGTLRARLGLPLPTGDPSRRVLTAAGLIEPYTDESTDYLSRLSSIRFHLAASTDPGLDPLPAPDYSQAASHLPLQPVHAPWRPHTNVVASPSGNVHDMCALRTADGRSLIAAGTRHGIGVWDSTTGQQLVHIPTSSVYSLAVAMGSSGRPFLVAGTTQGAAVFDPLSGRLLASLNRKGTGTVDVLADGPRRWMVAVRINRETVLWQPSEDLVHSVSWPDETKPAARNLWASDARGHRHRLCRTYSGYLALVDPLTQDTIMTGLANSSERTVAAATGPSGHDVLAIPRRREVQLVSPFDSEPLAPLLVEATRTASLDGLNHQTMLATVTNDDVTVWRLSEQMPRHMGRYPAQLGTMLLRGVPGGGRSWKLASAGHEGILLWDRRDGRYQRRSSQPSLANAPSTPRLMSVVHRDTGNELLVVATGHTVALIDPTTGDTLTEHTSRRPVRALQAVPGPNEEAVVVLEHDKGIEVWNAIRDHIDPVSGPLRRAVWCVVRLPDGDPALVIGDGMGLSAMNLTNATITADLAFPHRLEMSACLALPSPHATTAILWAERKSGLLLWDPGSNQITASTAAVPPYLRHTALTPVSLTPDRHIVAAATSHGITLWDTATWKSLQHIDTSLTTAMISLPHKNGSSVLVTASGTGVRFWDPQTGDLIHSLLTAAPVTNLAHTSVDGHTLHLGGPAGLAALKWIPSAASS